MSKNKKSAVAITVAAALALIVLISVSVHFFHKLFDRDEIPFITSASSSGEMTSSNAAGDNTAEITDTDDTSSVTTEESTSYAAESLPDYEVHTLPPTTEVPTTEAPTTAEPTTEAPTTEAESTAHPTTEEHPETTESPSETAETSSAEHSEYSDNSAFVGTWLLEYDLTKTQEDAAYANFGALIKPVTDIILRIRAELYEDGSLKLILSEADHGLFQTALNAWYSEAGAIYGETVTNPLQKAAFASWGAYRKGLYSLLSPSLLDKVDVEWHVQDDKLVFTDDEGEVHAELQYVLEDPGHLTVTSFDLTDPDYQSTADTMQEQLGFIAPYHLIKE